MPPAVRLQSPLAVVLAATIFLTGCGQRDPSWISLATQNSQDLHHFADSLSQYRIVVVGERHARIEPIDTVKSLLFDGGPAFTDLTMECPVSDQKIISDYWAGDDSAITRFEVAYAQTPGMSVEFCSIFQLVRQHNRKLPAQFIRVRFIDVPSPIRSTAEEARDEHMFYAIRRIVDGDPKRRVLVYVGSTHAHKSGTIGYSNQNGQQVQLPALCARLESAYPSNVVSIDVLSSDDPMWTALKGANAFKGVKAIPLTHQWPPADALFSLGTGAAFPPADQLFDYAIWWPTSRAAARVQ
jgi:hypothetical protein